MHQAAIGRASNGNRPTPLTITGVISELEEDELALAHIIDWTTFWAAERPDNDWLAYPLAPRGRAIALYAPAKAGKSSVVLALATALATGRPIFGQWECQPTSVLYLDYEMTEADIEERLTELGYGPTDNFDNLHYALLPSLPPLDTRAGAQAVLTLVEHYDAQLVVIDTFRRATTGDEDKADTVNAFYQHTGLALKGAGRTVLRADHSGKDLERGQRGSSAKADDVDVVWQLRRTETGVAIKRTHSRVSWVPDEIKLDRRETDRGINWTIVADAYPPGTKDVAELLDTLHIPVSASSRQAAKALREAGNGRKNALIVAAQRWRTEIAMGSFGTQKGREARPGSTPPENDGKHPPEAEAKPLQEAPGKRAEAPSESYREAVTPLIEGVTLPGPPLELATLDLTNDPIFGTQENP